MHQFTYTGLPSRVVFGAGKRRTLADEVRRLDCRRAFVIASPRLADECTANLGELLTGVFTGAVMHTPVEVTETALAQARACGADCTVAVGGGSAVGLGKAIALRTGFPQICLPTTYSGSEMTPVVGQTQGGEKTTQRSLEILPETVIYDVDLTLSLPANLSATSGINAIAHAVEALYAQDRNPIVSLMSEEAIGALARALPVIVANPADREARADALYGAWLCGASLAAVGMALHHKLCHVLGGTFNLPHAETHTVVLPHAAAYNALAAPEAMARVARALGGTDAARELYDLSGRLGAPRALKDLGMPEAGIERAADLVVKNPYWNPRPIERDAVRDLIARAWAGAPPLAA